MPADKKIKIGFLVGKDTDLVEDKKYVGNASFLKDMPSKYRVDPKSHEYCNEALVKAGVKGQAHTDCAIAWYIMKNYPDVEVSILTPEDITLKNMKANMVNYILGYDVINAVFEGKQRLSFMKRVFEKCGNLMPSYNVQNFIYYKSDYMGACQKAGVPMAPTIFAQKGRRSPKKLLAEITERGWKTFVMKQSFMAFSLGFRKLKVEDCKQNPKILQEYFEEFADCPEFVVQECVDGFTRNWETRCFWFNGKFLYAIANKAAVSSSDGAEHIVTGDDIPKEFLDNAKRIGKKALKALCDNVHNLAPNGKPVGMTLVRTDVGCSDSPIYDKYTKWSPTKRTFFLNEIEYGGTTYFTRHLKFDCIPMYADLYVKQSREIAKALAEEKTTVEKKPKKVVVTPKKPVTAVIQKTKAKHTKKATKAKK